MEEAVSDKTVSDGLVAFRKLLGQFPPDSRTHAVLVDLIAEGEKKLELNTPALTAQAAADYYHDLTAAQDMLKSNDT